MTWTVRDYRAEDEPALRRMHAAQRIDYLFPDLESPLFFVKKVLELDDGRVAAASVLKICAETFLLLDGRQDPAEKLAQIDALQGAVLDEAWRNGLDEVHAAVPPIGFDRRLRQLGWSQGRDGWRLWSRRTDEGRG